VFSNFFFRKSCRLWDNVEKYCRAGRVTDDNMAHAHCMLDTKGYRHTHSGCLIHIALPRQQCFHERASVLSYTYTACLFVLYVYILLLECNTSSLYEMVNKILKCMTRFKGFDTREASPNNVHTSEEQSSFSTQLRICIQASPERNLMMSYWPNI
jgi:Na+/melibiose symporter-like transporter